MNDFRKKIDEAVENGIPIFLTYCSDRFNFCTYLIPQRVIADEIVKKITLYAQNPIEDEGMDISFKYDVFDTGEVEDEFCFLGDNGSYMFISF